MHISISGDRQSGKTETLIYTALGHAKKHDKNVVYIFCKDANQSASISFRLKDIASTFGWEFINRRDSIQLDNGSTIQVVPITSQATRGRSADFMLVDNIDSFDDDDKLAILAMSYGVTFRAFTSEKPYKI